MIFDKIKVSLVAIGILFLLMAFSSALYGQERLENTGFEDGLEFPVGWKALGENTFMTHLWINDTDMAHSGKRCIAIKIIDPQVSGSFDGIKAISYTSDFISLKPGQAYKFSAWVRGENLTCYNPYIAIRFRDEEKNLLDQSVITLIDRNSFDWKKVEKTFIIPQGKTVQGNVQFVMSLQADKNRSGLIFMDDVSLQLLNDSNEVIIEKIGEGTEFGPLSTDDWRLNQSAVKNFFPLATFKVCFPEDRYWIWDSKGNWLKTSASNKPMPEVSYALPFEGRYKIFIYLRPRSLGVHKPGLNVKLDSDIGFTFLKEEGEVFWKEADIKKGDRIIFSQPSGYTPYIEYLKFVPAVAEGKPIIIKDLNNCQPKEAIFEVIDSNISPAYLENQRRFIEELLKDYKKHNLNTIHTGFYSYVVSGQEFKLLMDIASKYDIKVIIDVGKYFYKKGFLLSDSVKTEKIVRDISYEILAPITSLIKNSESLLAYTIGDEPQICQAENLRIAVDVLQKLDPIHPGITCLCRDGELGGNRGKDNMKIIWETINPKVLLHDLYPIRHPVEDYLNNFDPFIRDIDDAIRQAGSQEIPLWMYIQTHSYPGVLRIPTQAEMRAQSYLAVAHGIKGLFFYMYETLLTPAGKPLPHYQEIGKIAGELQVLAPLLLKLRRTTNIATVPYYLDVQTHVDDKGEKYLIVVNKNVLESVAIEIRVKQKGIVEVIDMLTGQKIPSRTGKEDITFSLTMEPGNGKVVKLSMGQ